MTAEAAPRTRGTSNKNVRGSSYDVRARKHWLLVTWMAADETGPLPGLVRCYRCGELLDWWTLTVDRVIPGCLGGNYARNNIRPACGEENGGRGCNTSTGAALANNKALASKKAAAKRRKP